MSKIEKRSIGTELRAASNFTIEGRAASFNVESHDLGGFTEVIQPTAFARSLRSGDDVVCLYNHDMNSICGRVSNRSLTLSQDSRGLNFSVQLDPNNPKHAEIYAMAKRKDINACSFSFSVPQGGDSYDTVGGKTVRTLSDLDLVDVSMLSARPAYPDTEVSARAAAAAKHTVAPPAPQKITAAAISRMSGAELARLHNSPAMDITRQRAARYLGAVIVADKLKAADREKAAQAQAAKQRRADLEQELRMVTAAGNWDAVRRAERALRLDDLKPQASLAMHANGLRYDDMDDAFIYGVNVDSGDRFRYAYQIINGELVVDNSSARLMAQKEVS